MIHTGIGLRMAGSRGPAMRKRLIPAPSLHLGWLASIGGLRLNAQRLDYVYDRTAPEELGFQMKGPTILSLVHHHQSPLDAWLPSWCLEIPASTPAPPKPSPSNRLY
ncbi:uncharacterized protein PGTG_21564 [Puccinia graminis f. sp. tritici CRL 75-36-700-3]|uniref:Uncharacterized protein n=1 Tax=Puccinia graminis f. sp. tritici (strain CRL 75-36-700-3 / race SCCL) TaxID=418459 RepID=H6QRZ6_PUCGT|nr:uncharacterized protein PGTG_21564 [Puccinia graminis f. sp. tritici CRL 75-36-700-3]EHS63431.1 hypothetical protein PGTG_21564 [Puccinia graminis f. sp. tritici CRL 75-36-700-3]